MAPKSKRVRVCYVSHYPHMRMGGQRSMVALIKHLDLERFEPIVVTPGPGELSEHLRELGCRVFHVPLCPIKPRLALQIAKNIKQMRALFRQENVAIVHPDAERDAFVCGLACRKTTNKMVWHVRLTRQHHLDKYNVRFAAAVIGIAESVKQRFQDLPEIAEKYTTIYNGVDLETFQPADDKLTVRSTLGLELTADAKNKNTGFVLLFVGQLKTGKGIFDLVDALMLLREAGLKPKDFCCLMVGAPESDEILAKLNTAIAAAEIGDYVQIHLQQNNIHEWMQAANALILPSHEGVEGMGRVLFEAMACGTVAIGSDISGVRDAITPESGVLFDSQSPQAITSVVQALIADPDLQAQLTRGGLERARTVFGIKRHAQLVQGVYSRLLET